MIKDAMGLPRGILKTFLLVPCSSKHESPRDKPVASRSEEQLLNSDKVQFDFCVAFFDCPEIEGGGGYVVD